MSKQRDSHLGSPSNSTEELAGYSTLSPTFSPSLRLSLGPRLSGPSLRTGSSLASTSLEPAIGTTSAFEPLLCLPLLNLRLQPQALAHCLELAHRLDSPCYVRDRRRDRADCIELNPLLFRLSQLDFLLPR